jgi:predicted dehydrogenase
MWRHHPQARWIERQLREGEIGELRRIHGSFSFNLDRPEDFRWRDEQGGGALWDIGCYCVNAMRLFFGDEPNTVSARSQFINSSSRTDRSTVGWLDFGQERMGTFECSFTSTYDQSLTLTGTEGLMRIERPFSGLSLKSTAWIQAGDKLTEVPFEPDNAYEHMVAHFTRAAHDPTLALHPAEDGLAQNAVMEALAESAAQEGAPRLVSPF